MEDEFKKKALNFTRESVLDIMAEKARYVGDSPSYLFSCHAIVGHWISNEPRLEPTDEIVLLGPNPDEDFIYHSIIMRDDDIIGDSGRAGRNIDTHYDTQTGEYTTKVFARSLDKAILKTLGRITVEDFRNKYLDNTPDEPDIGNDHDADTHEL